MNRIIICPYCKKELSLFQSQIERRRGRIKCIGCGTSIPYDLERRPRRIGLPQIPDTTHLDDRNSRTGPASGDESNHFHSRE